MCTAGMVSAKFVEAVGTKNYGASFTKKKQDGDCDNIQER